MLIYLEILKQWSTWKTKASWLVTFMDIQNIWNHSPFICKPTQEVHDKQVPKHDLNK